MATISVNKLTEFVSYVEKVTLYFQANEVAEEKHVMVL